MASGRAHARAALAGNPSDGYGGAVLAVSVADFAAHAEVARRRGRVSDPPSALVDAAVARFGRGPCAVRWRTDVPREVGLAGSSAIVTATVRALCALHGHALEPDALAAMALAVETEDLGIAAGPQDRYAQAHEGLVLMDFAGARPRVERLDPALLPPLYLAWHPARRGLARRPRRPARARRTSRAVRAGMARLAGHARAAARRAARRRPRRVRRRPWTPRSTSAPRCSISTPATWRWCAPRAPRARARTTRAPAGLSSVPCPTASSLWRARCARWAARSSRRVSAPMTRLAPPHAHDRKAVPMPEPGPDDIEPVAHETLDRFATGTVSIVPFLALGVVCWQVWASLLHWSDIAVFAILYVLTGLRRDGRLPSPVHPPHLRHQALAARRLRRVRLGGDRGARHLVGGRPPQAPRVRRPAGRPAQPARRPRRGLARRVARPGPRAHGLALPAHPARLAQALRARPARRSGRAASSIAPSSAGRRRARRRVRAGLAHRRHA